VEPGSIGADGGAGPARGDGRLRSWLGGPGRDARLGLAEDRRAGRRLRRRHGLVHELEGLARRIADLREVGDVLLLAGVPDLVLEELGVSDDLVEGRPQVVPQASARVDLRVAHGGLV